MEQPRPGFVRLIAPLGSWEGPTWGGKQFPLRRDRTVDVPAEAVGPLLKVGGFVVYAEGEMP